MKDFEYYIQESRGWAQKIRDKSYEDSDINSATIAGKKPTQAITDDKQHTKAVKIMLIDFFNASEGLNIDDPSFENLVAEYAKKIYEHTEQLFSRY